jgi:1-acyl-sn-glycerol-3-phosphate acyltransferase
MPSPWLFLVLTVLLLAIPAWLDGPGGKAMRFDAMLEIRGPLAVAHRAFRLYGAVWHGLRFERTAPLPESGPAILIANHTCGIDHMLLQAASRRLLGFMIAREYYDSKWLRPLCEHIGCIPVNRNGHDLAAIRAALRALEEGRVLPIFPEGRILPASGRRMGEMKPGGAYLAIRAGVPVVPAYIIGTPATDEILPSLATPSRASLFFGEPIDLSDIPPERAGDKDVQAEVSRRFEAALLALQARAFADEDETGVSPA